jgi:hypothetical protein
MKITTKLTKAFAAFVGERGFEIANEDENSQQPGEDYKLARQILRNKRVLLPFLTKQASAIDFAVAQDGNFSVSGEAGTGRSVVLAPVRMMV